MFNKNRSLILLFVLVLMRTSALGQDFNVKVNLNDGSITEGKLLKISAEGVDINPGGNVKYRFISAERIRDVNVVELNKTIEFPLLEGSIPEELKEYKSIEGPTLTYGFPKILGIGSIGYGSAGDWGYYEGLNSGMTFRLGLYYYFHETDIKASRFLLGFTYTHSSISGEKIQGFEPTLSLNEYSFEFGRTTGLIGGGSFFYLLMGLVIVTNDLGIPMGSSNGVSTSINVNETKLAFRLEGDGSFYLGSRLSFLATVGYDVLLGSKKYSTTYTYNYNEPAFSAAGGIFYITGGLTFGF